MCISCVHNFNFVIKTKCIESIKKLCYYNQVIICRRIFVAFCEFSNEVVSKNFITLDNLFVSEFMPNASDNCVKVYLYGLYLCSTSRENNIESFSKVIGISKEDIMNFARKYYDLNN